MGLDHIKELLSGRCSSRLVLGWCIRMKRQDRASFYSYEPLLIVLPSLMAQLLLLSPGLGLVGRGISPGW